MTQKLTPDDPNDAGLDDPAGGLDDALAQPETEFVVPERKPVNTSTLVIFGILLLGAAGMYFMYLRSGPSSADAATPEQENATQTINTFLNDGGQNLRQMETMLRNTEKVVQQFVKYPSAAQIPLEQLQTNPFRYAGTKPKADPNADDAASKRKRDEQRQAALAAVQQLRLQSVVTSGNRKACMINNSLYSEGQQVDDFVVEKINPNAVVVKRGAYRFELRMQK